MPVARNAPLRRNQSLARSNGKRDWAPAQRKCAPGRLYLGSPSLHFVNACQLLVHPLQCSGEDLLSMERPFGGAREASTARIGLAPDLTLLLSCQSALLVAHLSQAGAQCPQPLGVVFINRG